MARFPLDYAQGISPTATMKQSYEDAARILGKMPCKWQEVDVFCNSLATEAHGTSLQGQSGVTCVLGVMPFILMFAP